MSLVNTNLNEIDFSELYIKQMKLSTFKNKSSEDWNKNIIESVRKYMGNGTIDINSSSRILTNKIKGKLSSSILELMRVYPKIKNSIESDTQYDLILTLDEIYKIIPKSQKKVKEYYPLINALRKIGINLTITSERRGRFSNKEE
jgi:hypothetical protein